MNATPTRLRKDLQACLMTTVRQIMDNLWEPTIFQGTCPKMAQWVRHGEWRVLSEDTRGNKTTQICQWCREEPVMTLLSLTIKFQPISLSWPGKTSYRAKRVKLKRLRLGSTKLAKFAIRITTVSLTWDRIWSRIRMCATRQINCPK